MERDDTAVKIKPTKYKDDFEDEKAGESPSHWQENYVANQVVTLYENNFDEATITTLETEGWKGLGQYDMSNGALRGKNANAYYDKADAYNWTDYTYETKMTIATKNASNTVDGYFGIRFGVNNGGTGIEYGIHYKS